MTEQETYNIAICEETILNLKHCLERVFNKDFKGPEWCIDMWPLEIQYIIDEWYKKQNENKTR